MSEKDVDAIRRDEASRVEAKMRAWIVAHPAQTLADDERAIDELLGGDR